MTLAKLDVFNVRNIECASIEPAPHLNFILGPNGSGKTSLLEAIYILGRARSFRSIQAGQVIRFQQDELTVAGKLRVNSVELSPSPRQGEDWDEGRVYENPIEAPLSTLDSLPPPYPPIANGCLTAILPTEKGAVLNVLPLTEVAGLLTIASGVRLGRRKREIMLAGKRLQSSADLIQAFPVQIIQPSSSTLLEDAPKYRRQFLDWGAFHLDPVFLENWRGYVRALSQRNALLRSGDCRDIEIWNHELSRYGTIVASSRDFYAEKLRPFFDEAARYFLGSTVFELRTSSGWNLDKSLDEALREEIPLDLRDGYTHSGPHKGDFSVLAEGRAVRNYLSRGQMKLLVYALLLAQAHLLEESLGARGCVLIDDLASELDAANRRKLLEFLKGRRAQFFISSTDPGIAEGLQDAAVFHVEHGRVGKF